MDARKEDPNTLQLQERPPTSFSDLPPEIKIRIVELVGGQDEEYRIQKRNGFGGCFNRITIWAESGSSSLCADRNECERIVCWADACPNADADSDQTPDRKSTCGTGILQLSLCCRELARIATPFLYSIIAPDNLVRHPLSTLVNSSTDP